MALEWLIDQMKEWVIAQAYATEAWVMEWITPVNVTGVLIPDATCTYFKAGTYNGKPYYRRQDSSFVIWWNPSPFDEWWISYLLGDTDNGWHRHDPNIEGDYVAWHYSGTPTVTAGYKILCTSFIDRGDPAASDGSAATLIKDSDWHEWDLSGVVPAGAKSILLRTQLQANAVDKFAIFRKKGHVNAFNRSQIRSTTANVWLMQDLIVAVDADRKVEYNISVAGITGLWISVAGWWL